MKQPVQKSENRFLTVEKAAEYLGLTEDSIRKMISRRQIPFYRPLRRRILLDKFEIEKWIKKSPGISAEELEDKP